jgi:hypothetical protein
MVVVVVLAQQQQWLYHHKAQSFNVCDQSVNHNQLGMCHEAIFKGFADAHGQGLDPMPLQGTVLRTKDMRGPS